MRLLYAAGPGNVIGTFQHWKKGEDDPSQPALTYSGQFFDTCRQLGAEALIISYHAEEASLTDGNFRLRHMPKLSPAPKGMLYHVVQILYGLRLVLHAVRFRPDYFVVAEGTTHWFVLLLLGRRIRLVGSLHCLLWLPNEQPNAILRLFDKPFFRKRAYALMAVSENIARQVSELTQGVSAPVFQFTPTYNPNTFQRLELPAGWPPFRVLFVGRVEANKGVFTLLEVADLIARISTDIQFDICGNGGALAALKDEAERRGLQSVFHCHGYCNRETTLRMFNQSHVVVVPTTSAFNEGFNKVVVEAVLSGRPFITSAICPALSAVRDAGLEVPPDDTAAYQQAILQLFHNPDLYEQKRLACAKYANQFYDPARGWAAALQAIISGFPAR